MPGGVMNFFCGKTICVTGGASGVGIETVKLLLSYNAFVYVFDIAEQPLQHKNLRYYRYNLGDVFLDAARESNLIAQDKDSGVTKDGATIGEDGSIKASDDESSKAIEDKLNRTTGSASCKTLETNEDNLCQMNASEAPQSDKDDLFQAAASETETVRPINPPDIHRNLFPSEDSETPYLVLTKTHFDVLISNLGTNIGNVNFCDIPMKDINSMICLNISLPTFLARKCRYTKFVIIGSILSFHGAPGYSLYCASKAYLRSFYKPLSSEGIDVMIVYPYKINTEMFSEVRDFLTQDAAQVADSILQGIANRKKDIFIPGWLRYANQLLCSVHTYVRDAIVSTATRWMVRTGVKKIE